MLSFTPNILKFTIWIHKLFICLTLREDPDEGYIPDDVSRYGFTYHERAVHLYFCTWCKIVDLPWQYEWVRRDILNPNGSLYSRETRKKKCLKIYELTEAKIKDPSIVLPFVEVKFNHLTKDSREQNATITLCGEEMEWRWKWFTWLPFPRYVRTSIDCTSDIELGERAGEWKGGMVGWSIPWNKDTETLEEAFGRWTLEWDGR